MADTSNDTRRTTKTTPVPDESARYVAVVTTRSNKVRELRMSLLQSAQTQKPANAMSSRGPAVGITYLRLPLN